MITAFGKTESLEYFLEMLIETHSNTSPMGVEELTETGKVLVKALEVIRMKKT